MPNRIIREGILSSEKIALLDWAEEVFYRRLQSIVDDYGRYEANPQLLRSKCYPMQTDDVKQSNITAWLSACVKAGLIVVYEVGGKAYLEIVNFGQQLRSKSKYPDPSLITDSKCLQVIGNEHLGVSVSEDVSVVVKEPTVLVKTEPSAPVSDPPAQVMKLSDRRIPCPAEKLLEAFHAECPTLPRVMKLNDRRRTHLTSRWREVDQDSKFTSADDGIEVFRGIFRKVNASDFLAGRAKAWHATFDWLTESSTNFLKVCEGHYDNDRRATK